MPNGWSEAMADILTSSTRAFSWLALLRAILVIIFGVLAIMAPLIALTSVAIAFGVYVLVDGNVLVVTAIRSLKGDRRRGWIIAQGVITALAGLAALAVPVLAGVVGGIVILWTIAVYSVITGVIILVTSKNAESGTTKTWDIVGGIISVFFGILFAIVIAATPGATLISLIWVAGIWAIAFGVVLIITFFRMRRAAKRVDA